MHSLILKASLRWGGKLISIRESSADVVKVATYKEATSFEEASFYFSADVGVFLLT